VGWILMIIAVIRLILGLVLMNCARSAPPPGG
jgi:hypothetical protein